MPKEGGVSGMKTILALLYATGASGRTFEEIKGRTKLEKLLFLLEKKGFPIQDYHFEAFDFGPCSMELYDDIEVLTGYNWVQIKEWKYEDVIDIMDVEEHGHELHEKKIEIFTLKNKGKEKGKRAFDSLNNRQQELIIGIKREFNDKTLIEILRHVYKTYPEIARKSRIRDKILGPSKFGAKKDLPSFLREEEI